MIYAIFIEFKMWAFKRLCVNIKESFYFKSYQSQLTAMQQEDLYIKLISKNFGQHVIIPNKEKRAFEFNYNILSLKINIKSKKGRLYSIGK